MKILEKGTPPKERKYVLTCYNCQTKFEFLEKEGKLVCDQRDGNYLSIDCPVCNQPVSTKIQTLR